MYIKVIDVFSNVPGGRYIEEGPYSGEEFRKKILVPAVTKCIDQNEILTIDFRGHMAIVLAFWKKVLVDL